MQCSGDCSFAVGNLGTERPPLSSARPAAHLGSALVNATINKDKDKDKDKYIGLSKVCGNMLPHTQKLTFLTF